MSSVIVLCPNGHRVTVSVTPTTLLTQIKEQACEKHGYSASKYGLKQEYLKKLLDLSTPFRLSGLSNRAKLELVPHEEKIVTVNVAIQLEGGERKQGKFSTDLMLLDIVQSLFPGLTPDDRTMMVYLQRQISNSQLRSLCLRDLGITQSAMLRLRGISNNVPCTNGATNNVPCSNGATKVGTAPAPATVVSAPVPRSELAPVVKPEDLFCAGTVTSDFESDRSSIDKLADEMAQELVSQIQDLRDNGTGLSEIMEVEQSDETPVPPVRGVVTDTTPLFFTPSIKEYEEVGDKFFRLNENDLRSVMSDLKKIQNPSFKFRSKEKDVIPYKQTVIRVRFPCGRVLQSFYCPDSPISEVYDFVSTYSTTPQNLQLFSGPPKELLHRDKTLHEMGLEPTALIHAGGVQLKESVSIVSEEIAQAQLLGSVFTEPISKSRSDPVIMDTQIKPNMPAVRRNPTSGKNKAPPKWFKMT